MEINTKLRAYEEKKTQALLGDDDFWEYLYKITSLMVNNGVAIDGYEAMELLTEILQDGFSVLMNPRRVSDPDERRGRYQRYLESRHWNQVRQNAVERAGYSCELCYSQERLEVHHRTYERIACEDLNDLIVLCHSCHSRFHDKLP